MKRRFPFAAGLAVLCFASVTLRPAFGQDVTLRYRWTKGEESRYRMTQEASATSSATGIPGVTESSVDTRLRLIIRIIVDDVAPDGTATLRQVIESARTEINSEAGQLVFDSATTDGATAGDPLSKSMSAAYSAIVKQPITVVISPTGSVKKIEGMERILEMIIGAQSQGGVLTGGLDRLRQNFGDDATAVVLARSFAPFPDRPLKPGDSWEDRITANVPPLGTMTTFRTWTLRGVENRAGTSTATIAATLTVERDQPKTDLAAPQPSPFKVEAGEGTGDVEASFDIARGRAKRVTASMSQPTTMSGLGLGRDGSRISLQTLTKTTITIEWLETVKQ